MTSLNLLDIYILPHLVLILKQQHRRQVYQATKGVCVVDGHVYQERLNFQSSLYALQGSIEMGTKAI